VSEPSTSLPAIICRAVYKEGLLNINTLILYLFMMDSAQYRIGEVMVEILDAHISV